MVIMTKTGPKCRIIDGPSKFDLLTSLFGGKKVEFKQDNSRVMMRVSSAGVEDENNNSWNLKIIIVEAGNSPLTNSKVYNARYNSLTRHGVINID